jgi:hypothetical protein
MLSEMPAAQAVVDHTTQAQEIHALEALVLLVKVTLAVLDMICQTKVAVVAVQVQAVLMVTLAVQAETVFSPQ